MTTPTATAAFDRLARLLGRGRPRDLGLDALCERVRGEAAYLAQGGAYGYVRARTGLAGPKLLQDETFARGLEICKWEGFATAAQDLWLILEAETRPARTAPPERAVGGFATLYAATLALEPTPAHRRAAGWSDCERAFRDRLTAAFEAPPEPVETIARATGARLVETAPMIDAIRESDREIVMNNTVFRFIGRLEALRRDIDLGALARRLDAAAGVAIVAGALAPDRRLDRLVDPKTPMPEAARRVHGLDDARLAGQPTIAQALPELASFLGEAVVIGHSIAFDLALLAREAARVEAAAPADPARAPLWREPARVLDVAHLAGALEPALVDLSLDGLATWLGVRIENRHSGLGDATAAAELFLALEPRLRARGVRTLAEAEAFQARARSQIERERAAGWRDRPGKKDVDGLTPEQRRLRALSGAPKAEFSAPTSDAAATERAVDGFLYRHRLRDVMKPLGATLEAADTLREAARKMRAENAGAMIVEPRAGGGGGIVTERDVLNAIAEAGAAAIERPVSAIASRPVRGLPDDTFLYRALGFMARHHLRFLPVADAAGAIVGMFQLRALLSERAFATLAVGDRIESARSAAELAAAQAELPALAKALLADGLDAREVAGVISAEGRAMTARAAELAAAELAAEGVETPVDAYCVLVLGSGGRGESLLAPDQDNAMIVADEYPGDLDSADDPLTRLAARMNEILDRAGVPFCKGGVMAKNRVWRRRASEWRAQVEAWTASATPKNLLNVDIFFDFAPVFGASGLAETLAADALALAREHRGLSVAMGEQAGSHRPPLGLFGRFLRDAAGRVDLKAGGLLPVVSAARAMALRFGVAARATPERLTRAAAAAGAGETDARTLGEVHRFVLKLVLEQQIADIAVGTPPSSKIAIDRLTAEDRGRLREALRSLEVAPETVRAVLAGGA